VLKITLTLVTVLAGFGSVAAVAPRHAVPRPAPAPLLAAGIPH
jgi:hypothetical protein